MGPLHLQILLKIDQMIFLWRSVVIKILTSLGYYGGSNACPKLLFFARTPFEKIIVIVLHCTFSF